VPRTPCDFFIEADESASDTTDGRLPGPGHGIRVSRDVPCEIEESLWGKDRLGGAFERDCHGAQSTSASLTNGQRYSPQRRRGKGNNHRNETA
jgi:hypothetical protein